MKPHVQLYFVPCWDETRNIDNGNSLLISKGLLERVDYVEDDLRISANSHVRYFHVILPLSLPPHWGLDHSNSRTPHGASNMTARIPQISSLLKRFFSPISSPQASHIRVTANPKRKPLQNGLITAMQRVYR
jgi:hypothetical protein